MLWDEDFKGKMNYQAVREKLSGIRRVKKRDVFLNHMFYLEKRLN